MVVSWCVSYDLAKKIIIIACDINCPMVEVRWVDFPSNRGVLLLCS